MHPASPTTQSTIKTYVASSFVHSWCQTPNLTPCSPLLHYSIPTSPLPPSLVPSVLAPHIHQPQATAPYALLSKQSPYPEALLTNPYLLIITTNLPIAHSPSFHSTPDPNHVFILATMRVVSSFTVAGALQRVCGKVFVCKNRFSLGDKQI